MSTRRFLFVLVGLPTLEALAIDSYLSDGSFWHLLFLCLTTSLYIVAVANEIVSWLLPQKASAGRSSREAVSPNRERER